jgi:hypothetical protein
VGPEGARTCAEALALGRIYGRGGDEVRARAAFTRAIQLSPAPPGAFDPLRIEALRGLALACRRVREFEAAAACWRQLADMRGCPPHILREATEALAIHHEHRIHDLATARLFALRSLESAQRPGCSRELQHRLERLDRKMRVRTLEYEV